MPLRAESWIAVAPWVAGLWLMNAAVAMVYRRRAREPLAAASRTGVEIGVLREGIALLQQQRFESAKLRGLQAELEQADAARVLRRLERMMTALGDCEGTLALFASALIVRTQLWFAIERWRSKYGESLQRWMGTWAEFEALSALAAYAHEHPEDCYPEFAEEETVLEFRGAAHPCCRLRRQSGTISNWAARAGSM
jgi:hypothetical protein